MWPQQAASGQLICTRTWLGLLWLLLLCFGLWLPPLLLGEAAQSGLPVPRSRPEHGRPARLSGILGLQVNFKQRLREEMAQLLLQDLHLLLSPTLFLLVSFSSLEHSTKKITFT